MNASLRELKGLNNPTVAFHIRGGDLSADLQNNVCDLYPHRSLLTLPGVTCGIVPYHVQGANVIFAILSWVWFPLSGLGCSESILFCHCRRGSL